MAVTLHTNYGDMKLEVFCDAVPVASENFMALCASGYYDGTVFHRNIKGFLVQGGDPTGTGKVRVRCSVVRLGRPGVDDGRGSAPFAPPLTKP